MKKFFSSLSSYYACEQGGILITWAIIFPVVVGMLGLGMETGTWYLAKRNLQSAADAAAIAGAYESTSGARTSSATSAVSMNGFGNGSHVTVTVHNPPSSGTYTSNNNAVEVIISQPQISLFSGVLSSTTPTIAVRAVALSNTINSSNGCVITTATSGTGITITGNATLSMPNCTLISNSTDPASISFGGSSSTNVNSLYTAGQYSQGGASTLTTATSPTVNGSTTADPYSSINISNFNSVCDAAHTNVSINDKKNTTALSPGVYCGGLDIKSTATMGAGTYYIYGDTLTVEAQANLSGSGVTILLTGSSGNYATADLRGQSSVTLTAPTSGNYSGIAIYQDRNAPVGNSNKFNGGSSMNITGAVYMPEAAITFNGGSTNNTACTEIVANTISFSGNNYMTSNGCPSGMSPITTTSNGTVKLEE